MGGSRANYLLVEDGELRVHLDKEGGSSLPGLILQGEAGVLPWLRSCAERGGFLHDAGYAAGALLVQVEARVLVIGMTRWEAWHLDPDPFGAFPAFRDLLEVGRMRRVFVQLVEAQWPGWRVIVASPAAFGVQECVQTDVSRIPVLPVRVETLKGWTDESVRAGLRAVLAQVMPAAAFQRVKW
ncbi:hypothetical protein [Deinococcus soli (ex Cha et al. 2016)]|uniref:hypothetical protein n=1 Tax=Deinococcus soli (ex Cha et al. 2016) TaxID=1309411 RepID=UPI0016642122|nr:hypothetical protein [Deinococcus soli (ex Cha et al. 2016)]GGB53497.1 hypothetical protein GCM10008019_06350 [Deinococcus soli (ex Cha et al. 2016)]